MCRPTVKWWSLTGDRQLTNDSTAPGYLTPVSAPPLYDEQLERVLSRWIRGVTGLPASVVFPRWTDPQPKIPPAGTTWCAFGVTGFDEDSFQAHVQTSGDAAEKWSHEEMTIICCFYGPGGMATATRFRDGLWIEQNNAQLNHDGLTLRECGRIISAPELINNQWQRRYDVTVTLRRKIAREYAIKSLLSAPVKFFGE